MGITIGPSGAYGATLGKHATAAGYGQYLQRLREQQQEMAERAASRKAQSESQAKSQAFQAEQAQLARDQQERMDLQNFEQQKEYFGMTSKAQMDLSDQGIRGRLMEQGFQDQAAADRQQADLEQKAIEQARQSIRKNNKALGYKLDNITMRRAAALMDETVSDDERAIAIETIDNEEQKILKAGEDFTPPTPDEELAQMMIPVPKEKGGGFIFRPSKPGDKYVKPEASRVVSPDLMASVFNKQMETAVKAATNAAGDDGVVKPVDPKVVAENAMATIRVIHTMMQEFSQDSEQQAVPQEAVQAEPGAGVPSGPSAVPPPRETQSLWESVPAAKHKEVKQVIGNLIAKAEAASKAGDIEMYKMLQKQAAEIMGQYQPAR